MHTLAEYRDAHAELKQMIEDLDALLHPDLLRIRPNAKTAYQLLCDLGAKVHAHLSEEDRTLYPSLLIHEDPKVKSIAWGFISGGKPLRKIFEDYHKRWLKNCDFNFTEEFLKESREVFGMISQRVEREEQVLLPKLIEIGVLKDSHSNHAAPH